ncbi:MAG TPA: 30S ribosomal protein S6 [Candidatus Ozemobacteraceae bacterium]|nr:30S ribosomal protein S6 [Candidatus Ozemobacteraceae bacterium]
MTVKAYETLFFTEPEISEEALTTLLTKVEGAITRYGGEIEKVNKWGRRPLAYRVDKFNEGYYILVDFKGNPEVLKELERFYLINQNILRFLTTSRLQ